LRRGARQYHQFEPSPTDPMHLLLMKELRRALAP
jgi:hypothetical protein